MADITSDAVLFDSNGNILSSGTTLSGATITDGGSMIVADKGTAEETIVSSGGKIYVSNGGVADSTTVNSYGSMHISSGGVANSATVNTWGSMHISSGGTATDIVVSSGGRLGITVASDTYIQGIAEGSAFEMKDAVLNEYTINGGWVVVSSGGVANSTTVSSSGDMYISSGGVANSTTVNIYGYMYISSGGVANSTTVNSYGSMRISSGGVANSTTVNSGGYMSISSGGVANSTTVNSYGFMYISSGGTATDIVVSSGGRLGITVASDTYIQGTTEGSAFEMKDAVLNEYTINGGWVFVSSGGVANSTTVNDGHIIISSGGTATDIVVSSGGSLGITIASDTYIQGITEGSAFEMKDAVLNEYTINGGWVFVSSGGVANSTTVNNYGYMNIFSGGVANSTTVNDGNMYISSGGVADNTTVNSYGSMHISSDGVANSTTVNSGGDMYISSGGVANSTTVNSGFMYISSGGVANSTTVNIYGSMYISSGGVANSTTVSRGYMYISSGGVANSTTMSGGGMRISSGGVANSTTVNNYGYMYISSGGVANSTTVNSGFMYISSGGVANSTTVNSGGSMLISSGGTASIVFNPWQGIITSAVGATVEYLERDASIYFGSEERYISKTNTELTDHVITSGNSVIIYEHGVANSTTVFPWGKMHIEDGGVANSTTVSHGYMYISSGGVANSTTVNNYGSMHISSGGVANSTTVNDGDMYISSGGVADNTTVNSYGSMHISSDGVANSTTVNSGGDMYISSGGVANSTTVNSYGSMYVLNGGVANSTTVNIYGSMHISSGGVANNTIIGSEGYIMFWEGGSATDLILNTGGKLGGFSFAEDKVFDTITNGLAVISENVFISGCSMFISSGGVANSTTVDSKGLMHISSGGVANSTTVNSNGSMHISSGGVANSTTVNSKGLMHISNGGVANSTTVNNYGSMHISSGGVANSTTVNSGGSMLISSGGVANSTTVNSFGSMHISSGGVANSTTVSRGRMFISSGGVANNATVNSGGSMLISSGGVANNATVNSFGSMRIFSGGVANSITVNSYGLMYISSGGVANSTTVNSYGSMHVSDGGVANSTTVNSRGNMHISNGGVANSTTMSGGGMRISSGGVANSTTVSGGNMYISSGGVANSTTVNEWGYMSITSGGTATDIVVSSGGHLGITVASDTYIQGITEGSAFEMKDAVLNEYTINGGWVDVSSGGVANSITVNSKGNLYISSGGVANNTTVNSYGSMHISSGGVANSTTVNIYGYMSISSGGTATDIVVSSGGRLRITVASDTYIQGIAEGSAFEMKDAVLNEYTINGGWVFVSSGGVANSTTVNSYGSMHIFSGGTASIVFNPWQGTISSAAGATVEYLERDASIYFGSAGKCVSKTSSELTDHVITAGNSVLIYEHGVANNTTVNSRGNMHIFSGGVANSTTVNYVGSMYISSGGVANSTTMSGGGMRISSGGVADNTMVSRGFMYISSGGVANNTIVGSEGYIMFWEGGSATDLILKTGGKLGGFSFAEDKVFDTITNGLAVISENVFISGCSMFITSGGVANSTTVNSGGSMLISSGGVVNSTTVNSWGSMYIFSGGVANSTTVNRYGSMHISSGGVAHNTIVSSSGILSATSGTLENLTLHGGASLSVTGTGIRGMHLVDGEIFYNNTSNCSDVTTDHATLYMEGGTLNGVQLTSGSELYVNVTTGDAIVTDLELQQGSFAGTFGNAGEHSIHIRRMENGIVVSDVTGGDFYGVLSVSGDLAISGTSGAYELDLRTGNYMISGNDFSNTTFTIAGDAVVDLSGNYWGVSNIDRIYELHGFSKEQVTITHVLPSDPVRTFFVQLQNQSDGVLATGSDQLTLIFNHAVDAASLDPDSFKLTDYAGNELAIRWEQVNATTVSLRFDPLKHTGRYDLQLSGEIRDLSGNSLKNVNQSALETGYADRIVLNADSSSPRVVTVSPAGDIAGNISSFRIAFSEIVDPASLMEHVQFFAPDGTRITLAGYEVQNGTVIFKIAPQSVNGTYTLKVLNGVRDLAGNLLDQNNNGITGEEADVYTVEMHLTDIDLRISNVTLHGDRVTAGGKYEITWNVNNESGSALLGSWSDGVYLSTDTKWDINDKLLGEFTHADGLVAGGSLSGAVSITMPGVKAGKYYLLVRSDIHNEGYAAGTLDKIAAIAVDVAVPELKLGEKVVKTVQAKGDYAIYRITQSAGQALILTLDSLTDSANMEIFAGYGSVPTREKYDTKVQRITDGTLLLDASGSDREVYVMVHAKGISGSFDYELTASVAPLSIHKVTQNTQDNSSAILLTITGVNFSDDTGITLVDAKGQEYILDSVIRSGSTKLTATIAAETLSTGNYSLKLTGSSTAIQQDAVVIAGAGEGRLEYKLDVPSTVGRHMLHTLYITCSNTGTGSLSAPLVFFTPTQSHASGPDTRGAILTLDSSKANSGFWISSVPEGFSDSLSFFVSGNELGTIQPGETVEVPITYAGWRADDWDFGDSHINWNLTVLSSDDRTALNWEKVFTETGFSAATESALAGMFTESFGKTWGGYYDLVVTNMQYLNELGSSAVNDTNHLLTFEVMQKTGLLQPFTQICKTTDLIISGDTLDITIERTYATDTISREITGSLGYGWSFNWDIALEIAENGDLIMIQGGKRRLYQPTFTDSYQTAQPDGSELKKNTLGYKVTDADGKVWQFDRNGRLLNLTDSNQERFVCTYDEQGQLTRLTNTTTGQHISFTRDAESGFITGIKDSATGKVVTYAYNEEGDLVSVSDSATGILGAYEYFSTFEHALTKATDPAGNETSLTYDADGKISSFNTGANSITVSYGEQGEVYLTNGENKVTLYYDLNGNIAKITDDKTGEEYTYTFDANGNFVSGVDSIGNSVDSTYAFSGSTLDVVHTGYIDLSGVNLILYEPEKYTNHYEVDGITYYKTDALGNVLLQNESSEEYYVTGYDSDNNLVSYEFCENGITTTYTFTADGDYNVSIDDSSQYFVIDGIKYFKTDMAGNPLDQNDSTTDSITYGYDVSGNRVFFSQKIDGETNTCYYNAANQLISETDFTGTTSYTYDSAGNRISETTPDGTVYVYDANGNVLSETLSTGNYTAFSYDQNGNVASIDTNGKKEYFTYSIDGKQLLAYTDSRGNVYGYAYDEEGHQTSITVNGNTTRFTYDDNGNCISKTNSMNETMMYVYDANGNLTKFTDANGNQTVYTYAEDSSLLEVVYADGTKETNGYDEEWNLISRTNRAGDTISYTINENGDLTGITYADGRTVSFAYDEDGNCTVAGDINLTYDDFGNLLAMNYDDGRSISYVYNAAGMLLRYTDELGHAVNYTYDDLGQYDKLTDENDNLIIDYDYNAEGHLVKQTKGNGTYTVYSYDDYGQIITINHYSDDDSLTAYQHYTYNSEGLRTSVKTQSGMWKYTYNARNQLNSAIFTDNADNVLQNLIYDYDAMGNRVYSNKNGKEKTYTYNSLNQIVSVNGFNYRYDANGNVLEDEERIYTWTTDNRVKTETLKSTGQVWEYAYDVFGNRISSRTNGVTTSWTVDSNGNVIAEYIDGVWNRMYYQGTQLTGFIDKDNGEYYFNNDAIGTTISITGNTGDTVNRYFYDPFGNLISAEENIANDFQFVGGYGLMENESGSIFVRERNYDPDTGRWLSADPIGIQGGENLYAYCENNPVVFIDPDGRLTISASIGISTSFPPLWGVINFSIGVQCALAYNVDTQKAGFFVTVSPGVSVGYATKTSKMPINVSADVNVSADTSLGGPIEGSVTCQARASFRIPGLFYYGGKFTIFTWDPKGFKWGPEAGAALHDNKNKGRGRPTNIEAELSLAGNVSVKLYEMDVSMPQIAGIKVAVQYLIEQYKNNFPTDFKKYLPDGGGGIGGVVEPIFDQLYSVYQKVLPTAAILNQNMSVAANTQNGKIRLAAKTGCDNYGINIGVRNYIWFKRNENDGTWSKIGTTKDNVFEVAQEKNTTVTYGLSVEDNDGCYNENGEKITSGGKSYYIVETSVTSMYMAPIAGIFCEANHYQFSPLRNKTFTFSVISKSKVFGEDNYIKTYNWVLGGKSFITKSLSLNITVECTNNNSIVWKYGSSVLSHDTNLSVSLTVNDKYGVASKNHATDKLSVSFLFNPTPISQSVDPNDKTVQEGVGDKKYITAGSKLSYKVEFENDPDLGATAPAQWVRVFDTLDGTKFDLESFELKNFCIAGNYINVGNGRDSYNETITLKVFDYTVTAKVSINLVTDEETGETKLVAEFMAIDPETGFMLQDVTNGMLPVNDAIGSGEGYINYTINAREDLPHGTEITNTAKIYFDFNDPIETPTTLNTVDSVAPDKVSLEVKADKNSRYTFTLKGADADSGVKGYNIDYSTDGKSFTALASVTGSSWTCELDSKQKYYFRAQAVDNVGNVSVWSQIAQSDTTPPKRGKITLKQSDQNSIKVTISGFSDNVKIARYDVYVGGKKVGSTTGTTYTYKSSANLTAGAKSFAVKAIDTAGNISTSAGAKLTVNLAVVGKATSKSTVLTWKTASVSGGRKQYEVVVSGKKYISTTNKITIKGLAVGSRTVTVYARSKTNKLTTLDSGDIIKVTDGTAPTGGKVVAAQSGQKNIKVTISGFKDNVKVTKYYVYVNGKKVATTTSTSYTYKSSVNLIGKKTIAVKALDAAGNISASKSVAITIKDVTAPSKVTGLKVSGTPTQSSAKLVWTKGVDNVGVTKYAVKVSGVSKTYTTTTNALTVKGLTAGKHTYQVYAYDATGRKSVVSTAYSFNVKDITKPTGGKITLKQASQNSVKITISSFKDNVKVGKYYVYLNGKKIATTTSTTYTYTQSANFTTSKLTFAVKAVDTTGNVSVSKSAAFAAKVRVSGKATNLSTVLTWTKPTISGTLKRYEITVSGKKYTSTTNKITIKGLAIGTRSVTIKAINTSNQSKTVCSGDLIKVVAATVNKTISGITDGVKDVNGITGSAANDIVTFQKDRDFNLLSDISLGSGDDKLIIPTADDCPGIAFENGAGIDFGAGNDTLDLGANALLGYCDQLAGDDIFAEKDLASGYLDFGTGNDTFRMGTYSECDTNSISFGDGNDVFQLDDDALFDFPSPGTVAFGAGNDKMILGNDVNLGVYESTLTLDFGSGTDTMTFDGKVHIHADQLLITGLENITGSGSLVLNSCTLDDETKAKFEQAGITVTLA